MLFQTNRLVLKQIDETTELAELLPIFNSNPDFIEASEPSTRKRLYALSDVQQYLWQESVRDNSYCLTIRSKETGQIIGTAALLDPNPNDQLAWIGLLLMDSQHQNQGFGAEAAIAIEQYFVSEGRGEARLSVLQSNLKAKRFWEKLGYSVITERPDNNQRLCWLMSKKL
ncbi:MAG: hypothetical protein A2W33_08980 [Chloroflexi bacterium RBG_16_52_11]|nr:MAG: hypothetical protein A2W33_08980 [Chloroflexi bacterium RBG_16_52_11]